MIDILRGDQILVAVRGGKSIPFVYVWALVSYSGSKYTIFTDRQGREYSRKNSKLKIKKVKYNQTPSL